MRYFTAAAALCLMLGAAGAKPTAIINILPGNTVIAGEEIVVEASASTVSGIIQDGRYVWDFGDGIGMDNGLACSHFYGNPGTYTVSLYVMDPDSSRDTSSITVTVTGDVPKLAPRPAAAPLMHLPFDNDLQDAGTGNLDGTWQGTAAYGAGKSGQAMQRNASYVTVSDAGALAGTAQLTVSVWARQTDPKETAAQYLLYKSGAFHLRVIPDDWSVNASVTTTGGTVSINQWISSGIDAAWHQYVLRWDGSTLTLYLDGVEKSSSTGSGSVAASSNALEIGSRNSGSDAFNGYIDDLKVFGTAISAEDITTRFELWHADFHSRIGQYIIAKVPPAVTATASNKIKAVLSDGGSYNATLLDKTGPAAEERFLLDQSALTAGIYTLTVQLLDSGNNELEKIVRKINKGTDGIPKVGINKDNAICVDGKPFFPVTPFILNTPQISTWGTNGYINTTYSVGWYAEYNVDTWRDYITTSSTFGLMTMGPGHWDGKGSPNVSYMERNGDVSKLAEYVTGTRDSAGMLFWIWDDEPDLGGDDQYIPAQVIRAWTRLSHANDPGHPVSTNLVGPSFIKPGWHFSREGKFNFMHNAPIFGQRTHIADVYGMDYYPIDWAPPAKDAMVWKLAAILDSMNNWNAGMVPYMSFVETSNIKDDVGRGSSEVGTPPTTPEQLEMLTWLNIVHGCKGINWFQHFTQTSAENFAVMAEFVSLVKDIGHIIVSEDPGLTVTTDDQAQGVRIDHMVRDTGKELYLFAVRLTEVDEVNDPDATITFTLPDLKMSRAVVINEGRTVDISGRTLQDVFPPNGVHLYKIPYGDTIFVDVDNDGYGSDLSTPLPAEVDCNDNDPDINPGVAEICDGIDNNCVSGADEGFPQTDDDQDSLSYCVDNCPDDYNPDQHDFDYDGIGDSCDQAFTWTEDFELRDEGSADLRDHKKNNDFTWQTVQPLAGVFSGDFSKELRMDYIAESNTFVTTEQSFGEFTLSYDVRIAWAADNDAGLVLCYQDKDNYYFLTHGGNADALLSGPSSWSGGLYKVEGGTAVLVETASLNLPHKDASYRSRYTITTAYSGSDLDITVSFKRLFDDSLTGTHTFTVSNAPFTSGPFGFYSQYMSHNHMWIDNIELETTDRPDYTVGIGNYPDRYRVRSEGTVQVYPNPFARTLNLAARRETGTVRLFDIHGNPVRDLQVRNRAIAVPDDLPNGLYLMEIPGMEQRQRVMLMR